jgi:hypothetical protein
MVSASYPPSDRHTSRFREARVYGIVIPSCCSAARGGSVDMELLADSEGRTTPAKVYPVHGRAEAWVVEAPWSGEPARDDCRTFTGRAGLLKALEYAHSTYGSAVYLSR